MAPVLASDAIVSAVPPWAPSQFLITIKHHDRRSALLTSADLPPARAACEYRSISNMLLVLTAEI